MNTDQIQGKWKQLKGTVRHKFGQLTDSDVEQIAGNREKFLGRLQERYGYSKEQAQRELDEWLEKSDMHDVPQTRTGGGSY